VSALRPRHARHGDGITVPLLNDMAADAGKLVSPLLPEVSWPTRGRPRGFLMYADLNWLFQAMPLQAADELCDAASGRWGLRVWCVLARVSVNGAPSPLCR
jgi:hypothetical protein